ncbi:MAG TPA: tetratricopeptide repeat protein [Candidatus Paceibacterota bacterium]|nr:tetratricopeptide repeat protein [Candidatus Paceibacterota bacterium]
MQVNESDQAAIGKSFFLEGCAAEEHGNDAVALKKFDQAVFHFPNCSEAWTKMGTIFLRWERYESAESCFRKLVELAPQHFFPHVGLAEALEGQKRFGEAAAERVAVIGLRRGYAGPHVMLAQTYRAMGEAAKAIQQLQIALHLPDADNENVRETIHTMIEEIKPQGFALIVNAKKRVLVTQS